MLAWFDFVATKILLGLYEQYVLAELGRILAKAELLSSILGVLAGVINAFTGLLAYESNQFALVAFFCHIATSLTDVCGFVNCPDKQKTRLIKPVFFALLLAREIDF